MVLPAFTSRPLSDVSRRRSPGLPGALRRTRASAARRAVAAVATRVRRLGPRKLAVIVVLFAAGYVLLLWLTLPDLSDPRSLIASQSTVITDRSGVELYRLYDEEDRTYIEGEKIPGHMKHAIIAIEDQRFYNRGCLDVRAIARAVVLLGRAGGGSTITRQLARNALKLTGENRYQRKIKEVFLGCELERKFTRDELLTLYLNWIPFGEHAYGIEQASRRYFNASAQDLTLAQAAILASLPQRPSYFNPYGRHVRTAVRAEMEERVRGGQITKASQIGDDEVTVGLLGSTVGTGAHTLYVGGRADQVLRNMQDLGFITEDERLQALEETESIAFEPSRDTIRAPHFVLWVKAKIEEMLAGTAEEGLLEAGGLAIETTLDWEMQQRAEERVAFHREDILKRFGARNIALLAVDTASREIRAYVGNTDYADEEHGGKIDMVHAPRQPGSSFKPFVYAAAFQQGFGPATPIYDVPTKIGEDEPQNFDGRYLGLLTMRRALGASRNIPAAKTFFLAGGEEAVLSLTAALGAPSPSRRREELALEREDGFDYGWPLALGAAETPLFEMVQAYSTFAAGGTYRPIRGIRRVTDKKGNILYEAGEDEEEEVLDERIAYQITSVLSDVSVRPNEFWKTQLSVPGFETAAKTGTSNKCLEWVEGKGEGAEKKSCKLRKPNNAWVIGYTPELTAGVWIGNADSSSLYEKGDGLNTASPVWRDFMAGAHRLIEHPRTAFPVPDGVVRPQVSELSGQLPTACTPVSLRKADVFLQERAPREPDPACQVLLVDKLTHTLASDACPAEARESGSFLVVRSLLPERFPDWREGIDAWVRVQMGLWYAAPDHSGSILPLPVAPADACDPSQTPGRLEKPDVSILFPAQGGTANYPSFRPQITYSVGSRVQEVRYRIDGRDVALSVRSPYTETLRVSQSVSPAGMHTLEVLLTDRYFNTVADSVQFRFGEDTGRPTVRFVEPAGGRSVPRGATLALRVEARDPDGGIKYVQFYLDDTLLSTKPKEPYEMTYAADLAPGTHRLRARAEDLAGNSAEDDVDIIIEP